MSAPRGGGCKCFRAIANSVSKHHGQDFASWRKEADGSKLLGKTRQRHLGKKADVYFMPVLMQAVTGDWRHWSIPSASRGPVVRLSSRHPRESRGDFFMRECESPPWLRRVNLGDPIPEDSAEVVLYGLQLFTG